MDTLDPNQPYERFGESYGSYPVLRIHDHGGRDLAGRIDGNAVLLLRPERSEPILDYFRGVGPLPLLEP